MALSMISQLNNNNYAEWIVGIEALLTHKGLWEVTCAPATDTHPNGSNNTKAIYSWRAKITEAHAELILNIKLTQYTHVQSTDMHEVWTELRRVHLAHGFGTYLAYRYTFWCMSKHPDQSMTLCVADVHHAMYRLQEIDTFIDDEDHILALTNGLPDSYLQLIVNLDSALLSELTLDYIITHLLNEESCQLSLAPTSGTTFYETALAAAMKPHTPLERITCFKCSKKGHYQCNCPSNESTNVAFYANVPNSPVLGPVCHSDKEDEILAW